MGDITLSWGARVSETFRNRIIWTGGDLRIDPSLLMGCMAFETARTFSPSVKNAAGSGATGLIQFMPTTAVSLGTTVQKLAAMSAEDQLRYVHAYFKPFAGRLKSIEDVYMAILWPAGIGKPLDHVLFDSAKQVVAFRQNAGLDINKDGKVTKGEAAAKVRKVWEEGLRPGNVWVGPYV